MTAIGANRTPLAAFSIVPFLVGALVVRQSLHAPEKGVFYMQGSRIERKDGRTYFKAMMYFNFPFGVFILAVAWLLWFWRRSQH